MSFELHLFQVESGTIPLSPGSNILDRLDSFVAIDQAQVGDFLLGLGPSVRFSARTELGEQYVYEDELGSTLEIIVAERHVVMGFPAWQHSEHTERTRRITYAVALALVARFGFALYDPQRRRVIRASHVRTSATE